jgi:hypothetical protein
MTATTVVTMASFFGLTDNANFVDMIIDFRRHGDLPLRGMRLVARRPRCLI